MKKIYLLLCVLTALLFYVFGCVNPVEEEDNSTVKVTGLGWVIENIDSSFWTGTMPPSHCFYNFWINYEGNISLKDIKYAKVTVVNSGLYWSIPLTENLFNSGNKVIGGWYRFYGDVNNVLPIGDLRAEVKLKNGKKSSFVKAIPAPGSLTTNSCDFVYTPEDYSTGLISYAPMIKRATVGTKSINTITEVMTINFTITDSNVYNGMVFLYDNANEYIGYTKTFRNESGNLTSMINGSTAFYITGTNNVLIINNSDITFMSGKTFNQISKFAVSLQDGNQYAAQGKYTAYDCVSVSVKTDF
jgi:hypothetical protein